MLKEIDFKHKPLNVINSKHDLLQLIVVSDLLDKTKKYKITTHISEAIERLNITEKIDIPAFITSAIRYPNTVIVDNTSEKIIRYGFQVDLFKEQLMNIPNYLKRIKFRDIIQPLSESNFDDIKERIEKMLSFSILYNDIYDKNSQDNTQSYIEALIDFAKEFDRCEYILCNYYDMSQYSFNDKVNNCMAEDYIDNITNTNSTTVRESLSPRIIEIVNSIDRFPWHIRLKMIYLLTLKNCPTAIKEYVKTMKKFDCPIQLESMESNYLYNTISLLKTAAQCNVNPNIYKSKTIPCLSADKFKNPYYEKIYQMLNMDYIRDSFKGFDVSLNIEGADLLAVSNKCTNVSLWNIVLGTVIVCSNSNKDDMILVRVSDDERYRILGFYIVEELVDSIIRRDMPPFTTLYQSNHKESLTENYIMIRNDVDIETLTEGINISKDGDITFKFSPKKNFMDEYAENHRQLKDNFDAGNMESVKAGLAFAFMMISIIDRDYIHSKSKCSTRELNEAVKAKMFFRNDFVTYLQLLTKEDKSFDFASYYKENDYDRYVLTLTTDTISGIQKLVKKILLLRF